MRFKMVKNLIVVLFLFVFGNKTTNAQESMIPDVSYTYLEKLISIAKENFPRVKSLENKRNIAALNLSRAKYSWFDVLTFSYTYQPKPTLNIINPIFFNGYQAGVSFNVYSLIQKPFLVKQAKEESKIVESDILEYDIFLTNDVKQKYFKYIQALTILRLQNKSVQDAESVQKLIQYKFEKNEESYANYSQASLILSNSKVIKISSEANFLIAKSDLEALLGEKLENIN